MERLWREACIDENSRYIAFFYFQDHIWPEFGFHPEDEIGVPVIHEGFCPCGVIDRKELVQGAFGEVFLHEFCRAFGAGCNQNVQGRILSQQGVDQDERGLGFTDAGGVQPVERALGSGQAGNAFAFIEARLVFFAMFQAFVQPEDSQVFTAACEPAIEF